jgi:hypothetical protein
MLTAQTAVTTPDDFSQLNVVLVYLLPLAGTVLFFPALLLLYFERIKDQLLLSLDARQDALETQTRFSRNVLARIPHAAGDHPHQPRYSA